MMDALSLAFVIYSSQILLVVSAAAMAEALLRRARPTVRLSYWRAIGVLCFALPAIASSGADTTAASVTFSVLPAQDVAVQTVAKALPTVGPIVLWIWACGAIAGLAWLLAGAYRVRQMRERSTPASLASDIDVMRVALAPRAAFRCCHAPGWSPRSGESSGWTSTSRRAKRTAQRQAPSRHDPIGHVFKLAMDGTNG